MQMPKYVVIGNVKHNGDKFQAGSFIEGTAKEMAPLVKMGTVKLVDSKKDKTNPDNGNGTGNENGSNNPDDNTGK